MVDRIEKLKSSDYWKIEGTADAKKDKRRSSDEEKRDDQKSKFEEKANYSRLIAKDTGTREVHDFHLKEIQSIFFKGVTTGRDQSSLEVDILLQDGSRKNSALISVSQAMGLKLMHHQPGDTLSLQTFGNDPYLTASVMLHPPQAKEEILRGENPCPLESPSTRFGPEMPLPEIRLEKALKFTRIVLYGVGGLLGFVLIVLFFRWFF